MGWSRRDVVWYLLRLGLAALLLMWDVRVFWFYGFLHLLRVGQQVEYLRALVRVLVTTTDTKALAITQKLGITEEQLEDLFERQFDKHPVQNWESFMSDARKALGRNFRWTHRREA